MFIKRFSLSLGLCGLVLASSALAINSPADLKGFVASKATASFQSYLANSDEAFQFFTNNPDKLSYVLGAPKVQEALASGKMTLTELTMGDRAKGDLGVLLGNGVRRDVAQTAQTDLDDAVNGDEIDTSRQVRDALSRNGKPGIKPEPKPAIKPGIIPPTTKPPIKPGDDTNPGDDNHGGGGIANPPGDVQPPVTTPPEREPVDMNAIPQDTSLDAKGWPKYLNVPADCPAADASRNYIYEFAFNDPWPYGTSTVSINNWHKLDFVEPWFTRSGSWFHLNITDKETFAIPFYAGDLAQPGFPVYNGLRFDQGGSLGIFAGEPASGYGLPGSHRFDVSECPGQFGEYATDRQLNRRFMYQDEIDRWVANAGPNHDINNPRSAYHFFIKPGKRYFLNIRTPDNFSCDEAIQRYIDHGQLDANAVRNYKRDGHYICEVTPVTNGTDFYTAYNRPPYVGPCLSQGPYPANYNYKTCMEHIGQYGTTSQIDSIRTICRDALGKAPEQRYEASVVGGRLRWTQGANKPGYDSYVCVTDMHFTFSNKPIQAWEDMATYTLCSRETEGYKRVAQAAYGNPPAESVQKCVFDDGEKIFRWKRISDTPEGAGPDWTRIYQYFTHTTIHTYWYDRDGALVGEQSVH